MLAHTESGDASGVARFKIPDVSDFPARTLLTISAGEREMETFETILSVVDAPKTNDGANAAARFAALETVDESAVEVATSEKRRAQKKAFAEALNKRNDGRSMAMNASLAPTGEMGTATGSPSAPAPGTTAAPPISGFDAMAMDAPASPDGGMGTATGSPSASPSSDVAMSNKTSATMGASPLFDVATSAQMGGTGAPPSASPSSDGETATKADASPRTKLAAAFLPSVGPMGTSASNDDLDAETPTAVVEEAAPNDFDGAVAELERALSDGGATLELESDGENLLGFDAPEKDGLDVRFYPTGGRLVAGRENVVWFECVDEAGRPVVGEFALNDSKGRVATAKTSEGGVGSLRWTPDVDEAYSLETAFDGKIAKIDKSGKNRGGDDKEKVAAEEPAQAELALVDSAEDWLPASSFETFRFPAPAATVERVAFSVPSRVLESGEGVELEIWVKNETPLAATVEKNGVALAQRVWTAKKGRRRVVVPLDENASGVLN
ncbi:MAG: hypothetical protein IJY15_12770, partial [Thermoguttaceae bacterium]|nr:hypothetical protein [Thermoguttaceae bacterium]